MTDPRCPGCNGTRQWFPDDGGVIVHADNGCPLCDLQGGQHSLCLIGEAPEFVLPGVILHDLAQRRPYPALV